MAAGVVGEGTTAALFSDGRRNYRLGPSSITIDNPSRPAPLHRRALGAGYASRSRRSFRSLFFLFFLMLPCFASSRFGAAPTVLLPRVCSFFFRRSRPTNAHNEHTHARTTDTRGCTTTRRHREISAGPPSCEQEKLDKRFLTPGRRLWDPVGRAAAALDSRSAAPTGPPLACWSQARPGQLKPSRRGQFRRDRSPSRAAVRGGASTPFGLFTFDVRHSFAVVGVVVVVVTVLSFFLSFLSPDTRLECALEADKYARLRGIR